MSPEDAFTLELSGAEFLAAARPLNLARWPVGEPWLHGALGGDVERKLMQGQASLVERGLLRQRSLLHLEIDPLLAGLLLAVGAPEHSLILCRLTRQGKPAQAHCFVRQGLPVWVEFDDQTCRLTVDREPESLIAQWPTWLGAKGQDVAVAPAFILPAISLARLVDAAWREPAEAWRQLRHSGLSQAEADQAMSVLPRAEFASGVALYSWEAGESRRRDESALIGTAQCLWSAAQPDRRKFAEWVPVTARDCALSIRKMAVSLIAEASGA